MIPVEIEELSPQVMFQHTSSKSLREESDLTNEAREMAHIREKALKHRITQRYNSEVIVESLKKETWYSDVLTSKSFPQGMES